jgi:glycosyltransferase involved in cell wall biosynthesis
VRARDRHGIVPDPIVRDPSRGEPRRTIRALEVIPGDPAGASMIHAKRQVASLADLGIETRVFYLRSRTAPLPVLRELARLRAELSRQPPDLIHAHYGSVTAFLCAIATTRPLVITYRGSDLSPVRGYSRLRIAVAHFLSQVASLRATRIVCVSETVRGRLWWRRRSAVVIPSGVDTTAFAPADRGAARRELGWDPDRRIVLFNAGRDPELKRLDLARAAVGAARSRGGEIDLVVLDGSMDPSRMPAAMNAADCLLLTSDSEASPNVVKEAIACGLPVVTVDVGDVRQRLRGIEPSAVVARDVEELGRALADVLAERRRSNGPAHTDAFAIERVAARIRDVYDAALTAMDRPA